MLPVLKIFEENIKVESLKKFDYKEYKRATSGLIQVTKKALKIENKLVQIDNKELDCIVYNVFEYNHSNGSKCLIEINPECKCLECSECDCVTFRDKGICFHFISSCIYLNLEIPGLVLKKNLVFVIRIEVKHQML